MQTSIPRVGFEPTTADSRERWQLRITPPGYCDEQHGYHNLFWGAVNRNSVSDCFYFPVLFYTPPLWSSGQSSWRSSFDSRRYQIFWEVVGLERGPLSLVSTIKELLEWKISASDLENRDYGRRDSSRWPRGTLYPQKLVLTLPTSGGPSVGIVHSRTQATEFSFYSILYTTTCFGPYGSSSGGIYTVTYGSYYAYNGSVLGCVYSNWRWTTMAETCSGV
jgi:hypothetical protein